MTRKTVLTYTSSLAIGVCMVSSAHANDNPMWPKTPYSADMTVQADGRTAQGKVFVDGSDLRVELATPQGPVVQIINRDSGQATMLMQTEGRKMAIKMDASDILSKMNMPTVQSLRKSTGRKRIDGVTCQVYAINASQVCMTKNNIALETIDDRSGATTTFTNLDRGRQDAALFTVPAGYKFMDLGGMLGSAEAASDNAAGGSANIPSGFMDSIRSMATSGDDKDAEAAAMDDMLQSLGLPAGTASRKTTTSDVLFEGIDGMMYEDDAERQKAMRMQKESQRDKEKMEDEAENMLQRILGELPAN